MEIVNAQTAAEISTPHQVSVRALHSTEHTQVTLIELKPGEALKRHITPVDVFFYILEGQGIVEMGQEREQVSADELIVSPARIPHRLLNESDSMFRFLVVKTPRPAEKTQFI